jgi:hypothetical protein
MPGSFTSDQPFACHLAIAFAIPFSEQRRSVIAGASALSNFQSSSFGIDRYDETIT